MAPPNEAARPTASAPEKPDTGPAPVNVEGREVIGLLQRIVELLDDIDASLANIGGKLDQIHERMP
jgi:hypothetical protein